MNYADWRKEVVEKLSKRGVPMPDYVDSLLQSSWDRKYSADVTAMIQEAYWRSNQPAKIFNEAKRCGCFRCRKFFTPDRVIWEDGIAECPYCGIDACLPESDDYPLSEETLKELAEKQFS